MKKITTFLIAANILLIVFMGFLRISTPLEREQQQTITHERTGLRIVAELYENTTYIKISMQFENCVINRTYFIRVELSSYFYAFPTFQKSLNSSFIAGKETHFHPIEYYKDIPPSIEHSFYYIIIYIDWMDSIET